MGKNVDETGSKDLLINNIFYKTGSEIARIPYELLFGIRTLRPEDIEIKNWLHNKSKIIIKYVYRGRFICVEHGLYLEGIALFVSKDVVIPKNTTRIKKELYESFKFFGIDSKMHKEWGITPEQAIFFFKVEDELKITVDKFIYDIIKDKAKRLGAGLEFTSLNWAMKLNQNYEYRMCYPNLEEFKKHDDDGSNSAIKQELEKLISKNNFAGIYNDIAPAIRFVVK